MWAWAFGAAAAAAFVAAAKVHGRSLRLERQQAGYATVLFGGENPPWVENLWRRDRRWFWALAPVAGALLAAPFVARGAPGAAVVAGLAGGSVAAFLVLGFASLLRTRRRARATTPPDGAWARAQGWPTAAWWLLGGGLAGVALLLGARVLAGG